MWRRKDFTFGVKLADRAHPPLVTPRPASTELLSNPTGKALSVWVIMAADELVKVWVVECLLVEPHGEFAQG